MLDCTRVLCVPDSVAKLPHSVSGSIECGTQYHFQLETQITRSQYWCLCVPGAIAKLPHRITHCRFTGVLCVPDAIANSPHHISGSIECGTQYHFQLETQIARCLPGDDGGMNVQAATQWIDGTSEIVSKVLNVPESRYRWSSVPPPHVIFVVKRVTIRLEFSPCLSFCLWRSLFLSLCFSLFLFFSPCLPVCLSVSLFVFLSVSVCLSVSLCLFASLPASACLPLTFSLFLSCSRCFCLFASLSCCQVSVLMFDEVCLQVS